MPEVWWIIPVIGGLLVGRYPCTKCGLMLWLNIKGPSGGPDHQRLSKRLQRSDEVGSVRARYANIDASPRSFAYQGC